MKTLSRKVLLIVSSLMLIISVLLFVLLFVPHNSKSLLRVSNISRDFKRAKDSPVKEVKVTVVKENDYRKELEKAGVTFKDSAFVLENSKAYSEFTSCTGVKADSLDPESYFASSLLLVVIREGSFIKEGKVTEARLKNKKFYLTYKVEDDYVLGEEKEKQGTYCYDFFSFKQGAIIDNIMITDRLF